MVRHKPSSSLGWTIGSSLWFALVFTYFTFTLLYILPLSSSKIPDLQTDILEKDGVDRESHSFVSRKLSIDADGDKHIPVGSRRFQRAVDGAGAGVHADGDSASGGGNEGDATTSNGCLTSSEGRSCCMQYTWPGNEKTQNRPPENPTSNISRTCAQVKEEDPAAACFDPIVYSYSNSSYRPDPRAVLDYCIDFSEACFCSSETCVKYTIFSNDDRKTIVNETHFCGTVTQNSNKLLDSGCYKETRAGRIHEVCICKGDYCNGTPSSMHMRTQWINALILMVAVALWSTNVMMIPSLY